MSDERTHLVPVACTGCGDQVYADPEHTATARCSACWAEVHALGEIASAFGVPDPMWSSTNNPAPPPAIYPPGTPITPFRLGGTMTLRCITCGETWPAVDGLTPQEISDSFNGHDKARHARHGWLVGPAAGSVETCAPCGGAEDDWRTPLPGGPDHSKCRRNKTRGRGRLCDCQHRTPQHLAAIAGKPITPEVARDTRNAQPDTRGPGSSELGDLGLF